MRSIKMTDYSTKVSDIATNFQISYDQDEFINNLTSFVNSQKSYVLSRLDMTYLSAALIYKTKQNDETLPKSFIDYQPKNATVFEMLITFIGKIDYVDAKKLKNKIPKINKKPSYDYKVKMRLCLMRYLRYVLYGRRGTFRQAQ